jgi:hypothetical protein
MNSTCRRKRAIEPDRDLVESAIVEVLQLANQQGITVAEFIQMLDRGMRVSDFLNAMTEPRDPGHTIDSDTVKSRGHIPGSYDS